MMSVTRYKRGTIKGPQRQRGVAAVIVTLGMTAMLAMAGFALDMGDVYINKTRLQNALDAAALSAAKELVRNPGDTSAATLRARGTFVLNQDEGNEQLASIATAEVEVEFSDSLVPWAPNSGTNFVRVWVDTFSLQSYLISVIGIDEKPVVASATAGPAPTLCPNIFPLMACGWDEVDADGNPNLLGGQDNHWGYEVGDQVILKHHAGGCPDEPTEEDPDPCNGPGNFNILDVGSGASAVRAAICGSGEYQCIAPDDEIQTQPGNIVGPVSQAINGLFGDYGGPVNAENCPNPDDNITEYVASAENPPPFFGEYSNTGNHRRVVPVPVVVCSEDEGGKKTMKMLDTFCFLITQKADHAGNTQLVHGEFLDPDDPEQQCLSPSHIAPDPSDLSGGPVIIVLYKDQVMADG